MKKQDLINRVVEVCADNGVTVTKKNMTVIVDSIFETIKEALINGDEVNVNNFGKFSVVDKPERTARNPLTGGTITVEAHRAPKFKYSTSMKNEIR